MVQLGDGFRRGRRDTHHLSHPIRFGTCMSAGAYVFRLDSSRHCPRNRDSNSNRETPTTVQLLLAHPDSFQFSLIPIVDVNGFPAPRTLPVAGKSALASEQVPDRLFAVLRVDLVCWGWQLRPL
jgi:hypothetical protein